MAVQLKHSCETSPQSETNRARSSLCASLDAGDLELLPSAPPGSHLTLAHRPAHTVRRDAQGGGVSRAVRHVLTHALIG